MITVKIKKKQSGNIQSFEMSGHANFDEHGKDLVCAGASAVAFGAVNALIELTETTPDITQGEEGGYLKVVLPSETEHRADIQLIIQTMIVSLQTIERDYGQHIQIIFKK